MRTVDVVVGGFVVVFGAFWIWQSVDYEFIDRVPGPGFLPLVLAVLITGLGILLIVSRLFGGDSGQRFSAPSGRELVRASAVAGVIVVATALMEVIGMLPALLVLVGLLLFGVERMRSVGAVLTLLVVPLTAYWLFGMMLGVRFPTGPLGI